LSTARTAGLPLPSALSVRDPGLASLRRAARVAVVVPVLAAVAQPITGAPSSSAFAVFGSFALLGLADFGGPMWPRARAYAGAVVIGGGLVALGSAASTATWSAVLATAVVAFVATFLGLFGGYLRAGHTAMLLAFIVAVSIPLPSSGLADVLPRLAGWGLAGAVATVTGTLLWPRHTRTRLRRRAADACRALGLLAAQPSSPERLREARDAVSQAHRAYDTAPLRPSGPARRDRAMVGLMIDLEQALRFAERFSRRPRRPAVDEEGLLLGEMARTLDRTAGVLAARASQPDLGAVDRARAAYRDAVDRWAGERLRAGEEAGSVLDALSGSSELRVFAYATLAIAVEASVIAGLVVRGLPEPFPHWHPPATGAAPWLARTLSSLRAQLHPGGVWFLNSLRAMLALSLAVLVTRFVRLDHSFWVVFGTLSVLRSNALSTGRSAVQAVLGTAVGVLVASLLTVGIGNNRTALYVVLPIAAFVAAYVPTVVSYLVGQAAFTLFVVLLFDILQPQGWTIGLVRLEDVALGILVSLVVAALFWPRGARGQLRTALAGLYRANASTLGAAFGYLLGDRPEADVDAGRAAVSRELDRAGEAFDAFLNERGSRKVPMITWGRVAAAGNDVLVAVGAMEAMGLLGYRTAGCEQCVSRVRRDVGEVVGEFAGFAAQLEGHDPRQRAAVEASARTRVAVEHCLRAWKGSPETGLDRTAIGLATAWFWDAELVRLGEDLTGPLAAVSAAARSPWWR
jgi:uncharacterized membrane protein YccC